MLLELDAGTRRVKLYPYQWVDPNHFQPDSPWRGQLKLERTTPLEVAEAVHNSEILRYLAAARPQFAPQREQKFASASFALEKNPRPGKPAQTAMSFADVRYRCDKLTNVFLSNQLAGARAVLANHSFRHN